MPLGGVKGSCKSPLCRHDGFSCLFMGHSTHSGGFCELHVVDV